MASRLEHLFREHHAWLIDHVRRFTRSHHGAEDVAGETFLQLAVYKELDEIREPRALLTTMARRVLTNLWRRRDLEQAYLEALAVAPMPTQPSPEDRLRAVQALLAVEQALAGLPVKAREAFLYSQLDGLTYAEIGAKLGVSASMVRQYMVRATLAVVAAAAADTAARAPSPAPV